MLRSGRETFWPLEGSPESQDARFGGSSEWQWLPVHEQEDARLWEDMTTWTTPPHRRAGESLLLSSSEKKKQFALPPGK